jgi:hypothetical protein
MAGRRSKPHIAVAYPSRGTGHDPTIFGVIREIEAGGYPHTWCPAFYLPIPDAHNDATRQALADPRVTHVWYLENDHLLPLGILDALLAADAPIAAAEYRMRNGLSTVIRDGHGEVVLVGLGCTLVRREVLAAIPDPPFVVQTRQRWHGGAWIDTGIPEHAGGQDIYFCQQLRAAGYRITVLDPQWQIGHLDVEHAGGRTNRGIDRVVCYGGAPEIPWRPQRRVTDMPEIAWLKHPQGTLVIDMDKAHPNYQKKLKQGWIEISEEEARPQADYQERRNAEIVEINSDPEAVARAMAEDDD